MRSSSPTRKAGSLSCGEFPEGGVASAHAPFVSTSDRWRPLSSRRPSARSSQLFDTGSGKSETQYDFGIYQLEAFYQVAKFPGASGNTTLELGAGARYIEQELRIKAEIDLNARIQLGKLADRLEQRIRRIENRDQRLASLAAFNAFRAEILEERIVRAEDKGHEKAVARSERQLKRVDRRGEALAALEALERLQLELLQAALNLNGREFNDQFAFIDSGNMSWVDPVIALRLKHDFGNGRSISAMGDFGGFNVDDGLSWQAVLMYDCEGTLLGFETTTSLGYKALWLRYEEETSRGALGVDVVLHGPVFEVAFRW
ncbi:hypothetical protein [Methyloceanibacter sp.]|uniref:hypothetical protein n=1 Tax=Methyloceanibacter sp. TaxID=1965321 RepID=UPI00356441D0